DDNQPKSAGNVVKAMASARDGYPHVVALFDSLAPSDESQWHELVRRLDDGLVARVHEVNRLTPTIVEVVVRAPFAARKFEPGQFFRLQNYETYAKKIDGTALQMEGIALTGAWTDPERGLLTDHPGDGRLVAAVRVPGA